MWMLLFFLMSAAFLAVLIVVIVRQSRPAAPTPSPSPRDTAHRILASGEVTPEEYGERAQVLDHRWPPSA